MAGKYEQHKARLLNLECCIADKAFRIKEAMEQQAPDLDCRTWELKVLTSYYDALKCFYPYDCRDVYTYTGDQAYVIVELSNFGLELSGNYTYCALGIDMIGESNAGDPTHTIVSGVESAITTDFDGLVNFIVNSINDNPNNSLLLGGPYTAELIGGTPGIDAQIKVTGGDFCNTNDFRLKYEIVFSDLEGAPIESVNLFETFLEGTCDTTVVTEECCNFKHVSSGAEYELITPQTNPTAQWLIYTSDFNTLINNDTDGIVDVIIYEDGFICGAVVAASLIYDSNVYGNTLADFCVWIQAQINIQFALGTIEYFCTGFEPLGGNGYYINLAHSDCAEDTCCARLDINSNFEIEGGSIRAEDVFSGGVCPEYATITNPAESWTCMTNCLTDAEVESILCHINKLCDCDC